MPKKIPIEPKSEELLHFLNELPLFKSLSLEEIRLLLPILKKYYYEADEIVFKDGEVEDSAYIVLEGRLSLDRMGRTIKIFSKGDIFGEIVLFDKKSRTGTVKVIDKAMLLQLNSLDLEDETVTSLKTSIKIYRELGCQVTSYLREKEELYREMDVLLVQDGGCAPGYNAITAFITQFLENAGYQIYIAVEGFKSLVNGKI